MKATTSYFVFYLLLLFFITSVNGQWVQTNGPYGGSVYCFNSIDTTVFTGTTRGLYRSTVHGASWSNAGLTGKWITGLEALPTGLGGIDLIASAYGDGIYKSSDSGATWVNSGLLTLNIYCLASTPNGPGSSVLLAGTIGQGLKRSLNNGASWNPTGLSSSYGVYDLAISDSLAFAGTGSGIFRSIDFGQSWGPLFLPGIFVTCVAIAPTGTGSHIIYAGTYGNGIYRSADYGASWAPMNTGLIGTYLTDIIVHDTDVYSISVFGIAYTSGTDTSWSFLNYFTPLTLGIHDNGSGALTFFACFSDGSGVFRSYGTVGSWQPFSEGMIGRAISALGVFSSGVSSDLLFAGANQDGGGVFRSDNSGLTWDPTNLDHISIMGIGTFPDDSGGMVLLVGGLDAGTRRSTDSGATSNLVLGNGCVWVASIPVSTGGRNVFAATSTGANKSSDYGITWNPFNTGLTNLNVSCFAVSDTTLFAGTYGGGVCRTTNNGTTWTPMNTGITNLNIYSMAALDSNIFAGTNGSGIFYSSNNGANWVPVNTGLIGTIVYSIIFWGTDLFAGTNNGAFYSQDFGSHWTDISTGLITNDVIELIIADSNIYAATVVGVWRRSLSQLIITSAPAPPAADNSASILFNFPNPFNASTSIGFTVHQPGQVSLEIFNSAGEIVNVLLHEELQPGFYRRSWDATKMADGIYICRLNSGRQEVTTRLVLAR